MPGDRFGGRWSGLHCQPPESQKLSKAPSDWFAERVGKAAPLDFRAAADGLDVVIAAPRDTAVELLTERTQNIKDMEKLDFVVAALQVVRRPIGRLPQRGSFELGQHWTIRPNDQR